MSWMKKNGFIFPVLILLCFLIIGIQIYPDYGASADEHIQIEGGHIHWRALMRVLHRPYPPEFDDLPKLEDFQNRYYGQAGMFPVLIYEAANGFALDSSRIIRVRHLWSFLSYFAAAVLFSIMIQQVYRNQYLTAAALLLLILQPRLFGDIFYNDRDLMLISWMLIFLFCFRQLLQKGSGGWVFLSGLTLAVAVNVRIFGIVLLVFPFLYFFSGCAQKRKIIFCLLIFLPVMFLISPIAWDDPLTALPKAAVHFLKNQRSLDTGYNARLLFMNEKYYEHEVPWYYLPVYMIISTPVTHLIFAALGGILFIRDMLRKKWDPFSGFYLGMLVILAGIFLGVLLTRPVFYNGWRHFYFLTVPVLFFAVRGISILIGSDKKPLFAAGCLIILLFSAVTGLWIMRVHPYQIIYLNPLVRSGALGKFDRDYWLISTPECLEKIAETAPEGTIRVFDIDACIDFAKIGMAPEIRERFSAEPWRAADEPVSFILYNYTNKQGNEKSFPGYRSIYSVERDGMKIAEVFEYDPKGTVTPERTEETVLPDGSVSLTLGFDRMTVERIEFYECSEWDPVQSVRYSYRENDGSWQGIAAGADSANGYKFEYSFVTDQLKMDIPAGSGDRGCGKIFIR